MINTNSMTVADARGIAALHRERAKAILSSPSPTMFDWARKHDMADEHEKWASEFDALADAMLKDDDLI